MTLNNLEKAIQNLKPTELREFRRWFADSAAWDAQIEADAAAAKLETLAQEAMTEYYAG